MGGGGLHRLIYICIIIEVGKSLLCCGVFPQEGMNLSQSQLFSK